MKLLSIFIFFFFFFFNKIKKMRIRFIAKRIIWTMIGVYFLVAISKSIKITILNKNSYSNKTNSQFFNFIKNDNENPK